MKITDDVVLHLGRAAQNTAEATKELSLVCLSPQKSDLDKTASLLVAALREVELAKLAASL